MLTSGTVFGHSLTGSRCLVTGGLGFGGTHLVNALVAVGARVVVIDKRDLASSVHFRHLGLCQATRVVQGDVRDGEMIENLLRQEHIDTVFHLAAEAIVSESTINPYHVLDVNAGGTFTVLEQARQSQTVERFVFASSGAYYGDQSLNEPICETTAPSAATNLYAASKAAGDLAVQGYARTFGIRAAACRFMNTYGPGDSHASRIVPAAIGKLIRNEPYDFGTRDDGSSRLDFLYVDDMTQAYMAVADHLQHAAGDVFNFGSGQLTSIARVVQMVSIAYDGKRRTPIFRGTRQTPPKSKHLDITKARSILSWEPTTKLEEGISKTIESYRRVETHEA